jgi:hypothetical protein
MIATTLADLHRPDLEQQGIRNGRGGFSIRTPRNLLDGRPHWIWATVGGTRVALRRSPIVLHSEGRISISPSRQPTRALEPV